MKILVNLKLSDKTMDYHIRPITRLKEVESIFIVRDTPGPDLPKVEYHTPPEVISRIPPLKWMAKFFLMTYLSLVKRPDLINSYLLHPQGIMGFMVAKITRKPFCLSLLAGPVELYCKSYCKFMRCTEKCIGKLAYSRVLPELPRLGKIFLKMLQHCELITTMGPFTRDFLVKQGINADKIYAIPPVADRSTYHPMSIPKEFDIISVGRLVRVKHIETLLKAVSKVKETHKDIKVGVIGEGPVRGELEELSLELGIDGNVRFLGYKTGIERYFNTSKLFVLTSEREGGPFTVVEAMMCGIPPIVSNTGDIIGTAINGFNSIVIDDYLDVDGFAKAIVRLLDDRELYERLSKNALKIRETNDITNPTETWRQMLTFLRDNDIKKKQNR